MFIPTLVCAGRYTRNLNSIKRHENNVHLHNRFYIRQSLVYEFLVLTTGTVGQATVGG